MSKHNNNLSPSLHARCKCGRYATIGEWKAGIGVAFPGSYKCPDCTYHENMQRFNDVRNVRHSHTSEKTNIA